MDLRLSPRVPEALLRQTEHSSKALQTREGDMREISTDGFMGQNDLVYKINLSLV